MPIKGVKLCGAKCRTKDGNPCLQPGMKNGRCKMHGGVFYKKETHGCTTLRAKAERNRERFLLREMNSISSRIEEAINEKKRPSQYEEVAILATRPVCRRKKGKTEDFF